MKAFLENLMEVLPASDDWKKTAGPKIADHCKTPVEWPTAVE